MARYTLAGQARHLWHADQKVTKNATSSSSPAFTMYNYKQQSPPTTVGERKKGSPNEHTSAKVKISVNHQQLYNVKNKTKK